MFFISISNLSNAKFSLSILFLCRSLFYFFSPQICQLISDLTLSGFIGSAFLNSVFIGSIVGTGFTFGFSSDILLDIGFAELRVFLDNKFYE